MSCLSEEVPGRLGEVVDGLLSDARKRLAEYVLMETPTGDAAAVNSFVDRLEAEHQATGGRTDRISYENGDHLVTEWPGNRTDQHVLVLGHSDTVWSRGQLETMPYVDDGETVRGPGVYDMKGGLIVLETAMRALRTLGIKPAATVRSVVISDEEIGSPHGKTLLRHHIPGAIAALGLEPPHPGGGLKSGRKGSTRLAVRVTGKAAHAALEPDRGVSAIDELLDQLLAARDYIPHDGQTMFNIGTVSGGGRANVIPANAEAEIGLRFNDPNTEKAVLAALTGLTAARTGATVEVEVLSQRPTWAAPAENALLARVGAVGAELGQTVVGSPAAGGGDTNFTGAAGVPTLDGFGPVGLGAHAVEEQAELSSLPARAALLAALLMAGVTE